MGKSASVLGTDAFRRNALTPRGQYKVAALGGPGNDIPFEQAVSNLAHAVLRDKAPSLMDHELGFQLLDRDEDGTRAVGAMGFKVGSTQIIVPIFFLQGQVKGHEMMWLVNEDLIVPLKEAWLNWVMSRKPQSIGTSVTKNTAELGALYPDLSRLSRSPYKWASATPRWVQDFLPVFIQTVRPSFPDAVKTAASHLKWLSERVNMGRLVKEASRPMLRWIVDKFQRHPWLAEQYDRYYGLGTLKEAARISKYSRELRDILEERPIKRAAYTTGSVLGESDPVKSGALRIITMDITMTAAPEGLSEEERERLVRDRVLIQDQRPSTDISIPYEMSVRETLSNPTQTGLYWVLTDRGSFDKCFIGMRPFGDLGTVRGCVVVHLPTKTVMVVDPALVWCRAQLSDDEYRKWWESLPDADTLETQSNEDRMAVVIAPDRHTVTVPFRAVKRVDTTGGETLFTVYTLESFVSMRDCCRVSAACPEPGDTWLHIGGTRSRKLWSHNRDIWVPVGAKRLACQRGSVWASVEPDRPDFPVRLGTISRALPNGLAPERRRAKTAAEIIEGGLADDKPDRAFDKEELQEGAEHEREHTNNPLAAKEIAKDHLVEDPEYYEKLEKLEEGEKQGAFRLGKPADAELALMAKLAELKIYNDGIECEINGRRMPPMAALIHLVRDHGFREATAKGLLKRAAQNFSRTYRCRVKYAAPYLLDNTATAPPFPPPPVQGDNMMGFMGPTVSPDVQGIPSTAVNAAMTDPTVQNPNPQFTPPPYADMQTGGGGGGGGGEAPPSQKEIFDTSMLNAALRAVRDDTMVDRWLPDLMRGMDRIGRILLAFYWHGDAFRERFGAQDLPELEDNLRNSFEMLGDLVLFLRQRTVQPYPEEDAASLSLDNTLS